MLTAVLWHEFFWVKNMGKVNQDNYLGKLFWGASSIWSLLSGYPRSDGLMALLVFGLVWIALKQRKQVNDFEKMLWIWMASPFFMFSLANQRSSRYLLEAMSALAVLCTLYCRRIDCKLLVGTLIMSGAVPVLMLRMSLRMNDGMVGDLVRLCR